MKVKADLAPGTIRKRVGALARVLDWYTHRNTPDGTVPAASVLRLLPRGYSVYSKVEADLVVAADKEARRDISRERRLPAAEEALIVAALRGEKSADRERSLEADLPSSCSLRSSSTRASGYARLTPFASTKSTWSGGSSTSTGGRGTARSHQEAFRAA